MSKLKLSYLLIVFIGLNTVYSQVNNHWQLGEVDLDFSTNPAMVNIVPSAVNEQGYATVSDDNGDLLFYTDGEQIWNKNHNLIDNNFNYLEYVIRQPVVIIPYPNNDKKYYVFATSWDALLCTGCNKRFSDYKYITLDFTNNPLGEVIYPSTTIYSSTDCQTSGNLLVCSNPTNGYYESGSMTVVYNEIGNFYWLLVKEIEEKKLLAFKIDSNGISSNPVVSTFSSNFNIGDKYDASIIKVSPDNNKLAFIWYEDLLFSPSYNNAEFSLFNFNEDTGVITNQEDIGFQSNYPLSIEFSENSDYLYAVSRNGSDNGYLTIYDLNSSNFNNRNLKLLDNPTMIAKNFSYLQRDQHNNILVSSVSSIDNRKFYIHKIENQNSFSEASVRANYIYLNGGSINIFPQLIPKNKCKVDDYVTMDILAGYTIERVVSNNITASNTIKNGATALYSSGNSIVLEPGFHAEAGSDFNAIIEGCSGAFTLRPENYAYNDQINSISQNKSNVLDVFPNPTSSLLNVESKRKITSWNLYDSYGIVKIKKYELNELIDIIDLSILKEGVYILRIQLENGDIISKQIIKE